MDRQIILDLLGYGNRKSTVQEIVDFIGDDQRRFDALFDIFLGEDLRLTQVSSWPVCQVSELYPQLLLDHHQDLLHALGQDDWHNAVRRNIVRIYQFIEIPEAMESELYDHCLSYITDPQEAIAVRAFSMTVCWRIAKKYPELTGELIVAIEGQLHYASPGLRNRSLKVLKEIAQGKVG